MTRNPRIPNLNEAENGSPPPIPDPPTEEQDLHVEFYDLTLEEDNAPDDGMIPDENQEVIPPLEEEISDQDIVEGNALLQRLDILDEPENNVLEPVQQFHEASHSDNEDISLPYSGNDRALYNEYGARFLSRASPVFNSEDLSLFTPSYFGQALGQGFSQRNIDQNYNEIIRFFENRQIHRMLILSTDQWTPEENFIALQREGSGISVAFFSSHPRSEELRRNLERVVLH